MRVARIHSRHAETTTNESSSNLEDAQRVNHSIYIYVYVYRKGLHFLNIALLERQSERPFPVGEGLQGSTVPLESRGGEGDKNEASGSTHLKWGERCSSISIEVS